jgi:hypothetical protein
MVVAKALEYASKQILQLHNKKRVLNKGYRIVDTHDDGCNPLRKGIHIKGKRQNISKSVAPLAT